MTDEELTRICREHGFCLNAPTTQELAMLRAVAERAAEECARACDDCADEAKDLENGKLLSLGCVACASAIRAQGEGRVSPSHPRDGEGE